MATAPAGHSGQDNTMESEITDAVMDPSNEALTASAAGDDCGTGLAQAPQTNQGDLTCYSKF